MKLRGFAVLALAVALAGCTSPSPAPSPTPVPTEPTITSVEITSHPTAVTPGAPAMVCWRVEGSGHIPHTAVHYGNVSHAGSSAKFTDYPNAMYPGNQTKDNPNGYDIPASFCTTITTSSSGDTYFRGHALSGAAGSLGVLSDEEEIQGGVPSTALAVTLRDGPSSAAAGSNVTLCWDVQGTAGSIPRTALRTDTTSHQSSAAYTDYQGTAYFPANRTTEDPAGYAIPGTFCTAVQMPMSGTLYVRGHAQGNPPAPPSGVLSARELAIAVNGTMGSPTFNGTALLVTWLGNLNGTAPARSNVTVCWNVTATNPGLVVHTAVHTDTTSHQTDLTATYGSYKNAYYPDNQTGQSMAGYMIPGNFCTNVVMPAAGQVLYLRAHVIDSQGGNGKLSIDERQIQAV
jgi:hypothetical protein